MLELLGGDPEYYEPSILPLPESLRLQTEQGFKEVDGCVVPRSFEPFAIWTKDRPHVVNQDDETGLECLINKVHLDGLVPSETGISELARLGLDYAFHLKRALQKERPAGEFAIIVSAREPDQELNIGATCCVRFHRIRAGQVWLDKNLEHYKEEAIALCEFNPSTS